MLWSIQTEEGWVRIAYPTFKARGNNVRALYPTPLQIKLARSARAGELYRFARSEDRDTVPTSKFVLLTNIAQSTWSVSEISTDAATLLQAHRHAST
jgi:hypothetical protein